MMKMDMPESLEELLLDIFNKNELTTFIEKHYDGVLNEIYTDISWDRFVRETIQALKRRGEINQAFFKRVMGERPNLQDRIAGVFESHHSAPESKYYPTKAVFHIPRATILQKLGEMIQEYRWVRLTGESGVGKSTLLAELQSRLADPSLDRQCRLHSYENDFRPLDPIEQIAILAAKKPLVLLIDHPSPPPPRHSTSVCYPERLHPDVEALLHRLPDRVTVVTAETAWPLRELPHCPTSAPTATLKVPLLRREELAVLSGTPGVSATLIDRMLSPPVDGRLLYVSWFLRNPRLHEPILADWTITRSTETFFSMLVGTWLGTFTADISLQQRYMDAFCVLAELRGRSTLSWNAVCEVLRPDWGEGEPISLPEPPLSKHAILPLRRINSQYQIDHDATLGDWFRTRRRRINGESALHLLVDWIERSYRHDEEAEDLLHSHLLTLLEADILGERRCESCLVHLIEAIGNNPLSSVGDTRQARVCDLTALLRRPPLRISSPRWGFRRQLRQMAGMLWLPAGRSPSDHSPADIARAFCGALLPLLGWTQAELRSRGAHSLVSPGGFCALAGPGAPYEKPHLRRSTLSQPETLRSLVVERIQHVIHGLVNGDGIDLVSECRPNVPGSVAALVAKGYAAAHLMEHAGIALNAAGEWQPAGTCLRFALQLTIPGEPKHIELLAALVETDLGEASPRFDVHAWQREVSLLWERSVDTEEMDALIATTLLRIANMRKVNEAKPEETTRSWLEATHYSLLSLAVARQQGPGLCELFDTVAPSAPSFRDRLDLAPLRVAVKMLCEDKPGQPDWRKLCSAHALNTLASAVVDQFNNVDAAELLNKAAVLCQGIDAGTHQSQGALEEVRLAVQINQAILLLDRNKIEDSIACLKQSRKALRKKPDVVQEWASWLEPYLDVNLASALLARGARDPAQSHHIRAAWVALLPENLLKEFVQDQVKPREIVARIRDRMARPYAYLYGAGNALSALRMWERHVSPEEKASLRRQTDRLIRYLLESARAVNDHWVEVGVLYCRADLQTASGDLLAAHQTVQEAYALVDRHHDGDDWLVALLTHAEAFVQAKAGATGIKRKRLERRLADARMVHKAQDSALFEIGTQRAEEALRGEPARWFPWLFELLAETPGYPWQET